MAGLLSRMYVCCIDIIKIMCFIYVQRKKS